MEVLKSYISLVEPHLLAQVVGKPGGLISMIKREKTLSEKEITDRICGKKYKKAYYRNLKSRTIRILQWLAVVSEPKGNNLVRIKYEICQKNFLIGQKLLSRKQRIEGIRLIKEAYDIAVAYDFTHLACELSSIMYHHESYFGEKNKQSRLLAEQYATEMKRYADNYLAEKNMEYHFYSVVSQVTRSLTPEPIKEAIEQVRILNGTSVRFRVFAATLDSVYGFHVGDYELVIKSCKEALEKLQSKKGVYNSQYFSFLKDIGVAQMVIGEYTAAEKNFEQSTQYVLRNSFNDYLIRFYKTMNALRAGQYQAAYELYEQNKKCKNEQARRQFAIIEAYLHFMVYTGRLKLDKPFRVQKYLNDTFRGQADKRGENIAVVIAELLMYLAKNRGKFIDKVETVQGYSYRHLKGKDTQRAKWFIRILCMMPRANFHPIALARLAKKQIDNLEASTNAAGYNAGIEIIPFGELLGMIMKHLQKRVA